ncbi:hypothetical protein TEA_020930 [Camellia sinensis var. sinensis]|uniref:Potassium channel tetramerisation-type BTB domain-containing protein n=1 Tax=Camellia sinensis var. sinensis TaxID=542762 RepID=A0A4S4D3A2_CAMSN|nr:hypothetical protein TEA_020930 [Camellia sinensis var. sinensis]
MLAAMFSGRHTVCHDSEKAGKRGGKKMVGGEGKEGRVSSIWYGRREGRIPFPLGPTNAHLSQSGQIGGRKNVGPLGYVFVDRDGKHFRHVLNWLRDGVVPTLKDAEYSELLREAEYYQLLGLIDGINAVLDKRKDNEELDTELTRTDIIKCIQFEKVKFRGVNLSGLDLSKLDLSFVDFSYACLKNVFFSRANLQCAKFKISKDHSLQARNAIRSWVSIVNQIWSEVGDANQIWGMKGLGDVESPLQLPLSTTWLVPL